MAGYYCASEDFYENTVEKAPAAKIADKIQENYKNACFVVIDNKMMTLGQEVAPLKVFACSSESGRWSRAEYKLLQSEDTLQAVSELLNRGAMKEIVDFDNHLDNPQNDWTNVFFNLELKELLTMY